MAADSEQRGLSSEEKTLKSALPNLKGLQLVQKGTLPVFYRYSWDDGLSLKGRTAIFSVLSNGIHILELDPKENPVGQREILWNDLFCVYFTQWTPTDYWLDIITREGERYQVSLKNLNEARSLLKRWDATQIVKSTAA